MKGLEIARNYYEEYGREMIESLFPQYIERIATGLAGEGSECLGFDDDVSRDHDFEPGFCLWITKEDERKFGFALERAYAKLPKEFCGLRKEKIMPVGGNRHGVIIIEDFYERFLGVSYPPDDLKWWLYIPSTSLLNASNGQVFRDNLGEFSKIRNILKNGYPEDVRRKKLAGHTIFMAQAGLYNFERCIRHGEIGAAQLSLYEFVKHAISVIYLLNNKYEPFYKWTYKAMRELDLCADLEPVLTKLLLDEEFKLEIIQLIEKRMLDEFKKQNLINYGCDDLEKAAYEILSKVKDTELRNMHIMEGV